MSRGVDSTRMIVRGYGPDQPVASNRTEEGRALNRRTELRRLDEPGDSARVTADSLKALPSAEYSVETGSFRVIENATRLRDRLVTLGFDARLVGETAPYRVRVGRLATRREATSVVARLRARGVGGTVVRAELR
jgi:cell division protein FtsN